MPDPEKGQVIRSKRTGKQFTIVELTDNFVHLEGGETKQVLPKSRLWEFYTLKEN